MAKEASTWKLVTGGLAIFVLLISALGAWTKGTDWIGNTFIATDTEVDDAVDLHRLEVDPKIIELAANQQVLTKTQATIVWQGARDALERNEDRLFTLDQLLQASPNNADTLKRRRIIMRNIGDGEDEVKRTRCAVLRLDNLTC